MGSLEHHLGKLRQRWVPSSFTLMSSTPLQKAVGGKKDRSLFLFTDLLVCTTLKRKSGSLRRSSMSL